MLNNQNMQEIYGELLVPLYAFCLFSGVCPKEHDEALKKEYVALKFGCFCLIAF